jgi:tetratricopeptide (TPR) repeat protein
MGKDTKSIRVYDRIIQMNPENPIALNNLAWLLVTSEDKRLRDPGRAVNLARRAVAIEPSSGFLDTLAEAYYRNGQRDAAIATIKQAILRADHNRAYYEGQLKKFLRGDDTGP